MELESELRLGGVAGLAAVFDLGLWSQLVRRVFAPLVLLQAALAFAALVGIALLAVLLPHWAVALLPPLALLWLWPPVLRWFIGAVARRAVASAAQAEGLVARDLPPLADYRAWWRLPLLCTLALAPIELLGLGDRLAVVVALFALAVWLSTPALVRSVTAPWFAPDVVEPTLLADRARWSVLVAFWAVVFALLHGLVRQVFAIDPLAPGGDAVAAWHGSHLVAYVLVQLLAPLLAAAAVAMFCVAGLARMAAQRLIGTDIAPEDIGSPLSFGLLQDAARRARGATSGMAAAIVGVLAVAILWPLLRQPLILGALHLRTDVVQSERNGLACQGETFKLRMLHWAGVDASGNASDTALACAARNGHIATVRLLVALGDPVMLPVNDERFQASTIRLPSLMQAMASEKSLPAADYMLAHTKGIDLQARPGDGPDIMQAAAMHRCGVCVDWAARHHAPLDGTWQATPMALWLDNAGRATHEVGNLQHLVAVGLSAKAIGQDGRSALHAAANNGDLDSVNFLLGEGADPAQVDRDGNTPLLYAAGRLMTGPDNSRIEQDRPSDRERVQVVLRLLAVTPPTARVAAAPIHHEAMSPMTPYYGWTVDYEHAVERYAELVNSGGNIALSDLVGP